MDKKLKFLMLVSICLAIVLTISHVEAILPAGQCTVENPGGVNILPVSAEGTVSVWCPLTNTTYNFGCGNPHNGSIIKWIYGNPPSYTGAVITGLSDWRSAPLIWNDYEQKIYTYGSAQTGFTNKITSYDPTNEGTNTVVLSETLPCRLEAPQGAYSSIQNATYIFGGDKGGASNVLTDVIAKHTIHNNSMWNISTVLPQAMFHATTSTMYVPDLNIIVIAGGLNVGYSSNGGNNSILIFNCTTETLQVSSATIPYTYTYPTSDMASFFNAYDNLCYFTGGCDQTGAANYENAVWVFDPFVDSVENLETTQTVTISYEADDFGACYAKNLMMGQILRTGNDVTEQRTINVLNQTNATVIPQLEAIYQNFTISELTTYQNYKWAGSTEASDYPRYNNSNMIDKYPIFEWWHDASSSSYNLTFASNSAFTIGVVTITDINETNYPTEYNEFGPLVRFQIPTGVEIGNGTRYVKVNGSGESQWWTFNGDWEGAEFEFYSINGQDDHTMIQEHNRTITWIRDLHASKYQLQVSNSSSFDTTFINLDNISEGCDLEAMAGGNYFENNTLATFSLPYAYNITFIGTHYYRVRAYV